MAKSGTLTLEQESDYFNQIREGDKDAFDRFVLLNENLVFLVVRRYKFFYCEGFSQEDLIQEGYLGLTKAVQKFDNTEGFKFSTYAVKVINGFILRAIRKHGKLIKVPEFQQNNIKKLLSESKVGLNELFNEAYEKKYDKNLLFALAVLRNQIYSIDAPIDDNEGGSARFSDILPDDTIVDARQQCSDEEIVIRISNILDKRELSVVKSALGLNTDKMKLSEIGKHIGITRERVRQIFHQALDKIAVFLKEEQ